MAAAMVSTPMPLHMRCPQPSLSVTTITRKLQQPPTIQPSATPSAAPVGTVSPVRTRSPTRVRGPVVASSVSGVSVVTKPKAVEDGVPALVTVDRSSALPRKAVQVTTVTGSVTTSQRPSQTCIGSLRTQPPEAKKRTTASPPTPRSPRTSSASTHSPGSSTSIGSQTPARWQVLGHRFGFPPSPVKPGSQSLETTELQLGGQAFDPTQPAVRTPLLAALGVAESATVEAMAGFHGGLNKGIWFVKLPDEELVVKLVKGDSVHPSIPSEADNLCKVFQEHPDIAGDLSVAFPSKILRIKGEQSAENLDLIVMKRAPGQPLVRVIQERWQAGRHTELMAVFERVGACAATFHQRYGGKQHCDLQPSNILYDEPSGHITLIDVGGMGSACVVASDSDHFAESLDLLGRSFGPKLALEGGRSFRQGYARAASTAPRGP